MNNYFNIHKLFTTKKNLLFLLSFILPGLIFFSYFFYTKNGVLTVDLGQQYVDFLAFLRHNLFSHPLRLIYSFSNGLGGSMLATDAYYLFSPFNLLLFLFPQNFLAQVILVIIGLKIAAGGLTSYYYWQQKTAKPFYALATSSAYALSGYVIANHFNLMWLDSVILLPLLINEIDHILMQKKNHLVLITFLLWFTNFYTAFMALAFGFLYLLTKIFSFNKKKQWTIFKSYLAKSILGSFLDAFMLLPVFVEMLQGKVASSANWSWGFQFVPYNQIAKLADGAYNFHEMQEGMPNIFIPLPFLLLTFFYFLSKKINWKPKLANGLLLLFLIASLFWTPLVLLWHLGQFPVWYPGRFSFVLIFLALNLAITALNQQENVKLCQIAPLALIALGLILFVTFNDQSFDFLNETAQIATGAFLALGLLFVAFIYNKNNYASTFFYLIIELELVINLVLSLGNLAYQKNYDYQNFAKNTTQVTNYEAKHDKGLYRTEKSFYRSDDDPFSANYYGLSNFNSISNQHVLSLLNNLGFLNNSNSYTNFGGTPITDDLFGIKYYILPNEEITSLKNKQQMKYDNKNQRIDVGDYHLQKRFNQLILMKNSSALPLLFLSPTTTRKVKFDPTNITKNQTQLLQAATGRNINLFHHVIWPDPKKINVSSWDGGWMQYSKKKKNQEARLIFNLRPQTNSSYYLELPGDIDDNAIDMYINGSYINLTVRDSNTRLINLGSRQRGQRIQIEITLKKDNLDLNAANLWRLDTPKLVQEMRSFKQNQPQFTQQSALVLKSNHFSTNKKMTMKSTIPNSFNWLVLDNGKILRKNKILFADAFLNFNLNQGNHQITLIYIPWIFIIGLIISLISVLIFIKINKI
ncbi:YfhO family protein [Lactobacillus helveticus]|nr:YfhO family protein [Lactobacillus helveticus]KRO14475.1 abc transporter [Lactobacillus helveticus]MBW8061400.1 ABC transporter permease [Lactobacillus helveticus]